MVGIVFKTIKKKIIDEDTEIFTVNFDFPCHSYEEANRVKEKIESWDLNNIQTTLQ